MLIKFLDFLLDGRKACNYYNKQRKPALLAIFLVVLWPPIVTKLFSVLYRELGACGALLN